MGSSFDGPRFGALVGHLVPAAIWALGCGSSPPGQGVSAASAAPAEEATGPTSAPVDSLEAATADLARATGGQAAADALRRVLLTADTPDALFDALVDPERGIDVDTGLVHSSVELSACTGDELSEIAEIFESGGELALFADPADRRFECSSDGTRCVDCAWGDAEACRDATLFELHPSPDGLRLHGLVSNVTMADADLLPDSVEGFTERDLGPMVAVGTKCAVRRSMEQSPPEELTVIVYPDDGSAPRTEHVRGEDAARWTRHVVSTMGIYSYCSPTVCVVENEERAFTVPYAREGDGFRITRVIEGRIECEDCSP